MVAYVADGKQKSKMRALYWPSVEKIMANNIKIWKNNLLIKKKNLKLSWQLK
jgi:hypothetical protein